MLLNYPGLIRAFNKVETSADSIKKTEVMNFLSSLIDQLIQNQSSSIDLILEKKSAFNCTIKSEDFSKLLNDLKEFDIVLYSGITNEEALVLHHKTETNMKKRK